MTRPLALLGLALLAGCTQIDPLTSDAAWHPTGANAANLRRMVAVPGDLAIGRASLASDGNQAARAMDRLRTDRVHPLPDTAISGVGRGNAAPAAATGAPD